MDDPQLVRRSPMKITPYERAARVLTKSETQVRSDTDSAIAILGATNCSVGAGQGRLAIATLPGQAQILAAPLILARKPETLRLSTTRSRMSPQALKTPVRRPRTRHIANNPDRQSTPSREIRIAPCSAHLLSNRCSGSRRNTS